VKLACEMPETTGVPVSQWDCEELARKLVADGIVASISADTVWRILKHHKLKPWRKHVWLGAKKPRDAAFLQNVREICDLYTRPLAPNEVVISVDEKTSLQPRPRVAPTQPAQPGQPVRVEHEYERSGALNLIAGFDTRTGKVFGRCYARKRAVEFIDFLDGLDQQLDPKIEIVHITLDNPRMHKSKAVLAWLAAHPRFQFHYTPVHCSWMNQVEQWFGTLQRKRLAISDFASLADLEAKILKYIEHYNDHAQPYNWTTKSVTKVMAWAEREVKDHADKKAA
jgi:transposase